MTRQTDPQRQLIGPLASDTSWQAQQGQGFAVAHFVSDGEQPTVTCPQGPRSAPWWERPKSKARPKVDIAFAASDCQACPTRAGCTRGQGPRQLKRLPQAEHLALHAARRRQTPEDVKDQ